MKKAILIISLVLFFSVATAPVYAGGGQVQGDNSAQGDEQGDLGNGDSPGDDAMGNQA